MAVEMIKDKMEHPNQEKNLNRRSFFKKAGGILILILSLEGIWLLASYFGLGKKQNNIEKNDDAQWVEAGNLSDFSTGSTTFVRKGGFFISRLDDGGILALSMACTHLGCFVRWNETENKFNCPCHSSAFDVKGSILNSPAQRPLDYFPVSVKGSKVMVNVSVPQQRSHFEHNQVIYT